MRLFDFIDFSYSYLDTEHKSVFQIALSFHNFEKFAIKVAKKGCFHKLCDIIATICDVLKKFFHYFATQNKVYC